MKTPPANVGRSTAPGVSATPDDADSVSIVLMPQVGQRKPRAAVAPHRGQTRAMNPPPTNPGIGRYPSISRPPERAKGKRGRKSRVRGGAASERQFGAVVLRRRGRRNRLLRLGGYRLRGRRRGRLAVH